MAALQVLHRAGLHVADVDLLARLRVGDQQLVRVPVLQVVVGGDRLGAAAQQRVFGDALDALATQPDLPVGGLQPVEIVLSSTCRHRRFLVLRIAVGGSARRPQLVAPKRT